MRIQLCRLLFRLQKILDLRWEAIHYTSPHILFYEVSCRCLYHGQVGSTYHKDSPLIPAHCATYFLGSHFLEDWQKLVICVRLCHHIACGPSSGGWNISLISKNDYKIQRASQSNNRKEALQKYPRPKAGGRKTNIPVCLYTCWVRLEKTEANPR